MWSCIRYNLLSPIFALLDEDQQFSVHGLKLPLIHDTLTLTWYYNYNV